MPILGGKITKLACLATDSHTTDCVAPVSGQHLTRKPELTFHAGASHKKSGGVGQKLWPWTIAILGASSVALALPVPHADCMWPWAPQLWHFKSFATLQLLVIWCLLPQRKHLPFMAFWRFFSASEIFWPPCLFLLCCCWFLPSVLFTAAKAPDVAFDGK